LTLGTRNEDKYLAYQLEEQVGFFSIHLILGKCCISSADMFLCIYVLLHSWKFPQFLHEYFPVSDSLKFLFLQNF